MDLKSLKEEISKKINTNDLQKINEIKAEYLGKKGSITELSKKMKELSNEEKTEFGKMLNELKKAATDMFENKRKEIEQALLNKKLSSEKIYITLPSRKTVRGSKHPLSRVQEELEDLFVSLGYDVYEGPDIESDENCFQRLNLPSGHPARDSQDTFYLENEEDKYLLRTQTSTAQVHAMLENENKEPMRIVCPGKTYRRDDDATHSHQFMQFEGLVIGEDISLANLKATL